MVEKSSPVVFRLVPIHQDTWFTVIRIFMSAFVYRCGQDLHVAANAFVSFRGRMAASVQHVTLLLLCGSKLRYFCMVYNNYSK